MAAKKPPARKRPKPGELTLSIVVDLVVNEEQWRSFCAAQGIDLSGQVVGAHIARSVKSITYNQLKLMGFPQEES